MTNETIPNVPRELLEELRDAANESMNATTRQHQIDHFAGLIAKVDALLSAPSPAGVDGLEVVGWYRMDDRKAITPYPSVCATWHKMGIKVGAAYSDSAHVIIDGLRGEVAILTGQVICCGVSATNSDPLLTSRGAYAEKWNSQQAQSVRELRAERDQQAQRIGELEGLLLRVQVSLSLDDTEWGYSGAEKYKLLADIRTALSASKECA